MFKSIALLAVIAFAAVNAGHIGSHTIVEPAVAQIGAVVRSEPTAVSHQSFTRIHNKAEVTDIVAPIVRTVQVAPIVRTIPVQHVVKTIQVAPVVKTVRVAHAAPIVRYGTPVLRTYAAAPVVHAAPLVKNIGW